MSYVFPIRSFMEVDTRVGYLRAMGLYSILMASLMASSTFLIWQADEEVPWPLTLGMVFLAIIAGYSARSKKAKDTANTFWGTFALVGSVGMLMGQAGKELDPILEGFGGISFRFGPILMVSVLWAAFLVAGVAFAGLFFPRWIFEESWGLPTALASSLLAAILMENAAFLGLIYIHGGEAVLYHMTWWTWVGVALFLGLMGLCWKCRMTDGSLHDNAILASGGPLLNFPEIAEFVGEKLDQLGRAPGSDSSYWDEEY